MGAFTRRLDEIQGRRRAHGRRFVFVPYDQLTDAFGPLASADPEQLGIVVVESPAKAALRPYHKQKLALVLANLRHFALEQAERGVFVRHVVSKGSYADALREVHAETGPLTGMIPAERELRIDIAPLVEDKTLSLVRHEGWLTSRDDILAAKSDATYRMDAFYRHVRRRTGILMENGKPVGGRFSFDTENRKRWPGKPWPPKPLTFEPDDITKEVGDLVSSRFAKHPGTLHLEQLPATAHDAERSWTWAKEKCLPQFGPYEDAMTTHSRRLFHSTLSPLINNYRLEPARLVRETEASDVELASREGFIRQILGWREFVRHVHLETDGFRDVPFSQFFGGSTPLPDAYWDYGKPSGLTCLDTVVASVWDEAYSHHITRLMVLSNIATLLDVSPRELTDWFWVAYFDAYDWVVEPNVLAMGTYAARDLMTTKPYVAGAAYIDKMSDYCRSCAFDPKSTCPLTRMYWAFLERYTKDLADNPRMKLPVLSASRRSAKEKAKDKATFERARDMLVRGERLVPEAFEDVARSDR